MFDARRACELLVGLAAVNVLEILEPLVGRLEITVESVLDSLACSNCGEREWVKERPVVELVDLTCFGRPVTSALTPAAPSSRRISATAWSM